MRKTGVFLVILLLPLNAVAGVFEPLSSEEEYAFDYSAMTPTPVNELIQNSGNHTIWYDLPGTYEGRNLLRDETPMSTGAYYVQYPYSGGIHAQSDSYNYFDIADGSECYDGNNCLAIVITGGTNAGGTEHTSKKVWLADPLYGVGDATGALFYFSQNNASWSASILGSPPMDAAVPETGSYNRMSYYYKPHDDLSNLASTGNRPTTTHDVAPFNADGGHYYQHIQLNGGGWWHITVDTHPDHNNGFAKSGQDWYWVRAKPNYFDSFKASYSMQVNQTQFESGPVPYKEYVSKLAFWKDPEPQNDETINNVSSMWTGEYFEISFTTKYNFLTPGLFQLKYSFSPITNANWDSATPVHIREHAAYHIDERTDGVFIKAVPGYKLGWTRFDLQGTDETLLTPGTTIYFAIKDIGQQNGTDKTPKSGAECLGTYYSVCGTDYNTPPDNDYGVTWDYDWDAQHLDLIKRHSYTVSYSNPVSCETSMAACTSDSECATYWPATPYFYSGTCHTDPQTPTATGLSSMTYQGNVKTITGGTVKILTQ